MWLRRSNVVLSKALRQSYSGRYIFSTRCLATGPFHPPPPEPVASEEPGGFSDPANGSYVDQRAPPGYGQPGFQNYNPGYPYGPPPIPPEYNPSYRDPAAFQGPPDYNTVPNYGGYNNAAYGYGVPGPQVPPDYNAVEGQVQPDYNAGHSHGGGQVPPGYIPWAPPPGYNMPPAYPPYPPSVPVDAYGQPVYGAQSFGPGYTQENAAPGYGPGFQGSPPPGYGPGYGAPAGYAEVPPGYYPPSAYATAPPPAGVPLAQTYTPPASQPGMPPPPGYNVGRPTGTGSDRQKAQSTGQTAKKAESTQTLPLKQAKMPVSNMAEHPSGESAQSLSKDNLSSPGSVGLKGEGIQKKSVRSMNKPNNSTVDVTSDASIDVAKSSVDAATDDSEVSLKSGSEKLSSAFIDGIHDEFSSILGKDGHDSESEGHSSSSSTLQEADATPAIETVQSRVPSSQFVQRSRLPSRKIIAKLINAPRTALKSDIVQFFSETNLKEDDVTMVFDDSYSLSHMTLSFESYDALKTAQKLVQSKGRLGGRVLKLDTKMSATFTNDHPNLARFMRSHLGRLILMFHVPSEARLDDIEKFFEGYGYDPAALNAFPSISQATPRRPKERDASGMPVPMNRAVVGFFSRVEALRALRERQGEFLLNDSVELKFIQ